MAVLQFGFGDAGAHVYLPHRLVPSRVVYTGTHDNDTVLGWWQSLGETERAAVESLVGSSADGVNWALIRAAQGSVADLSVIPMQDILNLGSEARLNIPSKPEGNYRWRMRSGSLTPELAQRLAALAEITDRLPEPVAILSGDDFAA
jgi:4-alpha-glucanotransferase